MTIDGNDVEVPVFTNAYHDGVGLGGETVYNLVQTAGREFNGYSKSRSEQFRFSASATTQIGLHQLEFGGEYEKRTYRSFSQARMSRYYNDGLAELTVGDSRLNPDGYTDFYAMPDWLVASLTGNRGYDIWGDKETNDESLAGLIDTDINKPASSYNVAPYQPIFYGGYVQDKIEFRDIVLNLGLRVDVFDNNERVLIDQFARRPVERVADYAGAATIPSNMGSDYVIYYSGNDIVGFRSIEGSFFDASGKAANAGDISFAGKPNQLDTQASESLFKDYDPAVTVMPRIGVSFPVTDQALFFASYGVVTQRPSDRVDASLSSLIGTGGINNSGLQPEKTTSYELGFRQRLGARMAFTISGFFKQVENLIQRRELRFATPSVYDASQNVDFGTIKGVELGFDLRRTNGFSANINYTLSFADGTGSGSNTTGTIIWVSETPPNFISPLDFDQRHNLNVSLDYRLGQGEGPTLLGGKLLQNTGFNVLFVAKSGFPFTPVNEPENIAGAAKAEAPRGTINGEYSPGQSRVDLRVDRRFTVGSANLSAFIWVQNVFDQTNINSVWRYTGLPNDDGFLATPSGIQMIANSTDPTWNRELYQHRNRVTGWVGIPRLTRIGIRLDF
jgi:outer membrane receptor protein involved in Fe transport